ncbi:MAG: hypothetical protein K6T88_08580 [Bacillus sp. (in: Bacteria)]|nr:hypothetical protein [Bacillus sp. (in: firmicutes)]
MAALPVHLLKDRYWASLIHLFRNNSKLKGVFTSKYFNLEGEKIKIHALKKLAGPWSHSEKIMLNLALHLFNERNKFTLSDFDSLDEHNSKIAYEAIRIRFGN